MSASRGLPAATGHRRDRIWACQDAALPSKGWTATAEVFLRELPRAAWTDDVSRAFGAIKAVLESRGERLDDLDVAVGAHAVAVHGTLVTDNVAHLGRIPGIRIANWRLAD